MQFDIAKLIAEDDDLKQRLWLIKNGIPFNVAFSLSHEQVFAFAIIFSEFELPKERCFNWETMRFNEPLP